jgi:hypothetical protein
MAIFTASWGSGSDEADGLGNGIRRFSLAMSMLNFVVKIIVVLTYWRNLLN